MESVWTLEATATFGIPERTRKPLAACARDLSQAIAALERRHIEERQAFPETAGHVVVAIAGLAAKTRPWPPPTAIRPSRPTDDERAFGGKLRGGLLNGREPAQTVRVYLDGSSDETAPERILQRKER